MRDAWLALRLLMVGVLAASLFVTNEHRPIAREAFFLTNGPEYYEIDARDFWDRYRAHDCLRTIATVYDDGGPFVEFHCEG